MYFVVCACVRCLTVAFFVVVRYLLVCLVERGGLERYPPFSYYLILPTTLFGKGAMFVSHSLHSVSLFFVDESFW